MYDLEDLAADVARVKPNGDKNALRKTYKGQIKKLGIAGQFDSLRREIDDPSGFVAMLGMPDHEWNVQIVRGNEIADGLSEASLAGLSRAMTMAKGPVPKGIWDTSVLGDLSAVFETTKANSHRAVAPGTPMNGLARASTPVAADGEAQRVPGSGGDAARPKKAMQRKRAYGEDGPDERERGARDSPSFVVDGSNAAGVERGQKRRKKASSGCSMTAAHSANTLQNLGASPTQRDGSMRPSGYGSSAVGA